MLYCNLCSFFFFSSRRRHTRSLRDWSSDVCSSDLAALADELVGTIRSWVAKEVIPGASELEHADEYPEAWVEQMKAFGLRSEERRVGKECRSRWWPEHEIEKGIKEPRVVAVGGVCQ